MMIRIQEPSTTVALIKVSKELVDHVACFEIFIPNQVTETNPTTNVLDQVEK